MTDFRSDTVTRLLSLENTIGGKVLSLNYQRQARAFCDDHSLPLNRENVDRLLDAILRFYQF